MRSNPEDARVVEFEQRLRSQLAAALTAGEELPDLEGRVRRIADAARPRRTRRLVPYLVAATVLAVATVGLFLALRRHTTDLEFQDRSQLVEFLGTHVKDCPITIQRTIEEFNVHRLGEAVTDIEARLGSAPVLGDLDSIGLSFRGLPPRTIEVSDPLFELEFTVIAGSGVSDAKVPRPG